MSDAKILLATGVNYAGDYYMAGYAVECALKAVIAKNQGEYPYPDFGNATFKKENFFTHNLKLLVVTARLRDDLDAALGINRKLRENWFVVEAWSEEARYQTVRNVSDTQEIVDAISDPHDGVLSWIKQYW